MSTNSNGFAVHKAVVHSVDEATGYCLVHIPSLMGSATVPIPPTGLPATGESVFDLLLPEVGDVRFVAVDRAGTQYHWVVGAEAASVAASLSSLNGNVEYLYEEAAATSSLMTMTGEPTGIDPARSGTLAFSYGATTSTMTITPIEDTMDIYLSGVKYALEGPQVVTFATADGNWFIYYTESGWVASQTPWALNGDTAPVVLVYVNKTDKSAGLVADERHGVTMDWATHARLHAVDGTQVSAGGTVSGTGPTYYTTTTSNPPLGANLFAVSSATIRDEDIVLTTPSVPSGGPYFVANKTEATGRWTWTEGNSFPFLASSYTAGTDYIQYNQFTGATWQLTPLTSGQFVNYYVFATDFISPVGAGVIVVPGQAVHVTLQAALAESVYGLNLSGFPAAEFAPLYQITFLASSHVNWNDLPGRCAIASSPVRLIGFKASVSGATSPTSHTALSNRSDADSHPASAITFTPTGSVVATNVQDAIAEVATDASAISSLDIDGGTDIGTDLQDADLIIVDDGATGTNRKSALSRVATWLFAKVSGDITTSSAGVAAITPGVIVNADISGSAGITDGKLATIDTANKVSLSALDIDGGTDIGAAIVDSDLIVVDDGAGGTNRKSAMSRVATYIFGKVSSHVTVSSAGVATIANSVVTNAMLSTTAGEVGGATTTFTPTLTGSGSNPTLGTGGTATGVYTRIGKYVYARGSIQFGTSGAAAGSGDYRIALPLTAATNGSLPTALVWGSLRLSNLNSIGLVSYLTGCIVASAGTYTNFRYQSAWPNGTDTVWGAAAPAAPVINNATLLSNGRIEFAVLYEAA